MNRQQRRAGQTLILTRPPKPVNQMTPQERRAFAEQISARIDTARKKTT